MTEELTSSREADSRHLPPRELRSGTATGYGTLVPYVGADPARFPDFVVLVEDGLDEDHLDEVTERCSLEWSAQVTAAWFAGNQPTATEQRATYEEV